MKTLLLLITLLGVFVAGYMLGVMNSRPHEHPAPVSRPSGADAPSGDQE